MSLSGKSVSIGVVIGAGAIAAAAVLSAMLKRGCVPRMYSAIPKMHFASEVAMWQLKYVGTPDAGVAPELSHATLKSISDMLACEAFGTINGGVGFKPSVDETKDFAAIPAEADPSVVASVMLYKH